MASDFPPMTAFALAFAAEYKGFMRAHDVKGAQLAELLERGEGYVSERVNGKRADDELLVKEPPVRQRTAARKGTRKADQAPHAE